MNLYLARPAAPLAPTDVAGATAYESANWVNETTDEGADTTNVVRDDNGIATAISTSVTWVCDDTWSTDGVRGQLNNLFPVGPNQALMNGYRILALDPIRTPACCLVSQLPISRLPTCRPISPPASRWSSIRWAAAGGRNEYIYVNDKNLVNPLYVAPGGPGGVTTFYQGSNGTYAPAPLVGSYVQAIGDDPSYGPDANGNFVVVTNDGNGNPLTGTSVSIYVLPNTSRGALNGIQIVKNP